MKRRLDLDQPKLCAAQCGAATLGVAKWCSACYAAFEEDIRNRAAWAVELERLETNRRQQVSRRNRAGIQIVRYADLKD